MSSRAPTQAGRSTFVDEDDNQMPQPLGRTPEPHGLYDPRFEHDSCGVSFVAHLQGVVSRQLVDTALTALTNLDHRGATGAEPDTGDGAGILVQVPDRFLRGELGDVLPPAGQYAVGLAFLPVETLAAEKAQAAIEGIVDDEGLRVVAWRDVPVQPGLPRRDGQGSDAAVPPARRERRH